MVLKKEIKDNIAILTLNRPEKYNALNKELFISLTEEINLIESDENIGVIIITGAGEKAFCAGIDLKERAAMAKNEIMPYREKVIKPFYDKLYNCSKPVIAAINGIAYGGGAEIVLASDIRIASENAKFAQSEIKWGMIPSCGACQRLRLIVGPGLAKEIIFTGKILSAQEAYELHIYNHLVPLSKIIDKSLEIANEIVKNSWIALKQAKKVINFGTNIQSALDYEFEASKECFYHGTAMSEADKF